MQGHAGCVLKLRPIASKVGVSVKAEGEGVGLAADVSSEDPIGGVIDVAHESVKCLVTSL